jgi:hypothetical protein
VSHEKADVAFGCKKHRGISEKYLNCGGEVKEILRFFSYQKQFQASLLSSWGSA